MRHAVPLSYHSPAVVFTYTHSVYFIEPRSGDKLPLPGQRYLRTSSALPDSIHWDILAKRHWNKRYPSLRSGRYPAGAGRYLACGKTISALRADLGIQTPEPQNNILRLTPGAAKL